MFTALLILAAVVVVAGMVATVGMYFHNRTVCGWFVLNWQFDGLCKLLGVILSAIASANEN